MADQRGAPPPPTAISATTPAPPPAMCGNPAAGAAPFRGPHHRRSQSEFAFRSIIDDFDLAIDPFSAAPATSFEEIGSEDDLFSTYMDMEKIGSGMEDCQSGEKLGCEVSKNPRPRHRHSNSVDGSMMASKGREGVFGEVVEAKKAMAADKLAELAAIDPKKAKR